MAFENLVAYAVVLALPVWLVTEEVVTRFLTRPEHKEVVAGAAARGGAAAERRAPEGAHASSV